MGRVSSFPAARYSEPTTYSVAASAVPGSTSSASFVDFPGPVTKQLTKLWTPTGFVVSGHASSYKTTNTGFVDFGINLGGVDYWMSRFFFNVLSTHHESVFFGVVGVGLAPGVYTATLRWRAGNAAVNADSNDFIHVLFREGPAA